MLQYIYNAHVGISDYYLNPRTYSKRCLLTRCHVSNNFPAFLHIFKHLILNKQYLITQWRSFHNYLVEAVRLYPPHEELANTIISQYILADWFEEGEELIKVLMQLVNEPPMRLLMTDYSHLLPQFRPICNKHLTHACVHNNVKEIKHRLQYCNDHSIDLYQCITSPVNNREALSLILPLYEYDRTNPNIILIRAYVHGDLSDSVLPTAILHLRSNNDLLIVTSKFELNNELFYKCVKFLYFTKEYNVTLIDAVRKGMNISATIMHKVNAIVHQLENKTLTCDCKFCIWLSK